jgi:Fe2+ transport system protein FeoA
MTVPGNTLPLHLLPTGKPARITAIEGGTGFRKKMADMGILPGRNITVVHGWGRGPRVVVVDETRIMLGHGMLSRILVQQEGHAGGDHGS